MRPLLWPAPCLLELACILLCLHFSRVPICSPTSLPSSRQTSSFPAQPLHWLVRCSDGCSQGRSYLTTMSKVVLHVASLCFIFFIAAVTIWYYTFIYFFLCLLSDFPNHKVSCMKVNNLSCLFTATCGVGSTSWHIVGDQ